MLITTAASLSPNVFANADQRFQKQYEREFQLIRKINFQPDKFLTEIPKPRTVKINLLDALKRALSHNQEIQNDIASYKESLLSYQSTMFQFQFSAGSLSYDASYGYQDQGPSLSLSNSVSQTFPIGFEYSLSSSASNSPNSYYDTDMNYSTSLSLSQSLIGSRRASNINTLKSAREQLATAKLSLRDNISKQLSSIASEFRSSIFAQESLEQIKGTLKTTEASIERSKMLLSMGFISKSDLENIKVQKINTQLSINQQEFSLRETMNKLKLNLGFTLQDTIILLPDLTSEEQATQLLNAILKRKPQHKREWIFDAIIKSKTLISSRIGLDRSARDLDIAFKEKNMTLDARGNFSWASDYRTLDSSSSLSLNLPLDIRSDNNNIKRDKIGFRQEQESFLNNCLAVLRDESDNHSNIDYYYGRLQLDSDKMQTSKNISEVSKIKFKYGTISASDVQQNHQNYLNSIADLRRSENTFVESMDNYKILTNRYLNNLQIPLTPELDLIFQTDGQVKDRNIVTPYFIVDFAKFDPKNPYKVCQQILHAKIANL